MRYYLNRTTPTLTGIDALFNDIFGDASYTRKVPPVDVYEKADAYIIEASVAGYDEKDINLTLDNRKLTLSTMESANEDEKKIEERKYLMREIPRPAFSRTFTLPEDVDFEKISAENKNGVLIIVLPKMEKAQKGRIEIKIK